MNKRLLYLILLVQVLFAFGLIMIGIRARDNRRNEYLELTWLVSSGQATTEDFAKLKSHLGPESDAQMVRSLLGVPMQTASEVEIGETKIEKRTGEFWLYYPRDPGAPAALLSPESARKLSGAVKTFVVSFDEKGFAKGEMLMVKHPVK
jgi:hypothetical protein